MRLVPTSRRHRGPADRLAQRGISLVELLVSLLIFTFGMLGLAGLQTRTLSFNQSSLFRSQATALTDDVLDRMRADRANAKVGRWDTALGVKAADIPTTAFFQRDLGGWKKEVEDQMPAGSGRASIETELGGADAGTVTITIEWDDTRGAEAPQTFVTKTRL